MRCCSSKSCASETGVTKASVGTAGNVKGSTMRISCKAKRLDYVIVAVLWGVLTWAAIPAACAGDPAHELYIKNCAYCHGKDGKAQSAIARNLGVKDLSKSVLTDGQITQEIREGKQENQSTSKMPAFKEKLTPEEVESLIPVVKEFRKRRDHQP